MSNYDFFAGFLKYVGDTTQRETAEISEMMDELLRASDELKQTGQITVPADRLHIAARAMAGMAGFLQKQILPEVLAAENEKGQVQVRWVIDAAMAAMGHLLGHAELIKNKTTSSDVRDYVVPLPAPPSYNN